MERKYEHTAVGVLVGRFQTSYLHEAHLDLIGSVCKEHSKVIVFLGLSPCWGTTNNPLDFESRKQMILEKFPDVNVLYIKDVNNDKVWSKNLDEQISNLVSPNQTVTLYGSRDSFIAHYYGKFKTQELESQRLISATEIRKEISNKVRSSELFRHGVIWATYNRHPIVYTTVDVAVFCADGSKMKILMARKPHEEKHRFIGGFASITSESFEADARREVMEEAGIEIGNLTYVGSFNIDDWRYRNERDKIRTLFYSTNYVFGKPEASDDICELKWFDFDKITSEDIMPEHRELLQKLKTNR